MVGRGGTAITRVSAPTPPPTRSHGRLPPPGPPGPMSPRDPERRRRPDAPRPERAAMRLDEDAVPEPRRVRVRLEDVAGAPATLTATLVPPFGDVICLLPAAGCRYRQDALARLAVLRPRRGFPCVLVHEPCNPHDERAVAIWTRGGHSGYVPRALNPRILPAVQALEAEHGTPIAVPGDLAPAPWGLDLVLELPRELR